MECWYRFPSARNNTFGNGSLIAEKSIDNLYIYIFFQSTSLPFIIFIVNYMHYTDGFAGLFEAVRGSKCIIKSCNNSCLPKYLLQTIRQCVI